MRSKFITLILSILVVTANQANACNGGGPPNQSPVAKLEAVPEIVVIDVNTILKGSDSYDPDGSIYKYEWDFTSDGDYDYYETDEDHNDGAFDGNTPYKYDTEGLYKVTLRVTDNGLKTDTEIYYVHVMNLHCNPTLFYPWGDEVTTISYKLPAAADTTVKVYRPVSGSYILFATLLDDVAQTAGWHNVVWHGTDKDPNDTSSEYISYGGKYKVEVTYGSPPETMTAYVQVKK